MPSKLRRLAGEDVVRILEGFDFQRVGHRGSHVRMRRIVADRKQTLHVPQHKELRTGTLLAIYRQACQYIDESQLRPHFYTD